MNKNDYRRALLMLRSLKTGVSGYVRLERRTLIGTLQFTVNGISEGAELFALLLYRKNGAWSAVRLASFGAPRYGQTGLVYKFDPRSIDQRPLEQYDLAAVIEIRNGICDLLLCGNLNGAVEADWNQIREAACRLFSPIRISGTPISPIDMPQDDLKDKKESTPCDNHHLQTLPELNEDRAAYPGSEAPMEMGVADQPADTPPGDNPALEEESVELGEHADAEEPVTEQAAEEKKTPVLNDEQSSPAIEEESSTMSSEAAVTETDDSDMPAADVNPDELDFPALSDAPDDLDRPAVDRSEEPDELDTPASDLSAEENGLTAFDLNQSAFDINSDDQLDIPAQDQGTDSPATAGDQLGLTDPEASWPESIEPLRSLFFSSEPIVPFEGENQYVFVRAALPEGCPASSCLCGIACEKGAPSRVCYAIPAQYTPEPPVGLEGYVWRGDLAKGYWVICEKVSDR